MQKPLMCLHRRTTMNSDAVDTIQSAIYYGTTPDSCTLPKHDKRSIEAYTN
jgi:hypothetical protein